ADARQERHGMAHCDRICRYYRLGDGSEDLVPGAVVPEVLLNGLEMRPVAAETGVPGERLWTVVVGIELVDGQTIVARSREPNHQRDAKQRDTSNDIAADRGALSTNNSCASRAR